MYVGLQLVITSMLTILSKSQQWQNLVCIVDRGIALMSAFRWQLKGTHHYVEILSHTCQEQIERIADQIELEAKVI